LYRAEPITERIFSAMIRDDRIAMALGAVALALVLGALGFQFLSHLAPCEMCHWQRWPHIAAAILGLAGVHLWKKHAHLWVIAAILVTGVAGITVTGQWRMAPYIIAALVLIAAACAFAPGRRVVAIAAVLLVAASGLIGAYQTGMQMGILPGPSACTGIRYTLGSGAPPPEVSCNAVTWSLFGLSLAAYNAIFSLGAAALGALFLAKKA
jgi:disulfide bond formation protein DsbB